MGCLPPYSLMAKWLDRCARPGTSRVIPLYDEVVEVITRLISAIPVNEAWYLQTYPPVARFVREVEGESAASHYRKHGYFEDREPFAEGWRGLHRPIAFSKAMTLLHPIIGRGQLRVELERRHFLELMTAILRSVPVDEDWYLSTYPRAGEAMEADRYETAAEHFASEGYFDGCLPSTVTFDESWYLARYAHARNGLASGIAATPFDHFMRIGYAEGCLPAPQ